MGLTGYLVSNPNRGLEPMEWTPSPDYESALKRSDLHASASVRDALNPLYNVLKFDDLVRARLLDELQSGTALSGT